MNTVPWGVFRPGVPPQGYGFTHAASLWTPLHLTLAALAAVAAGWIAARVTVFVRSWLREREPAGDGTTGTDLCLMKEEEAALCLVTVPGRRQAAETARSW